MGRLRLSLYVGKMTLYLSAGMSITCIRVVEEDEEDQTSAIGAL